MDTAVTFALFFGCSLAFLYTQWRFGPRMLWLRGGLLFVMTAGLLWLGAGAPSPLSVRLLSLASAQAPADDALIVGNHHDYADLVVTPYASDNGIKPATPAHDTYVKVSTVTGIVDIRSTSGDPATGEPAMIAAWQQGKGKRVIAGAVPLPDTAEICLDRTCRAPLRFKAAEWKSILLPNGTAAEDLRSYHHRAFRPGGLAAKRSAILYDKAGGWYLLALDKAVYVKGAAVAETAPRLDPRHPVTVSLFRLDMPDPQFAAPARLSLRSSFSLMQKGSTAVLTPGKPMIRPAGTCKEERLTLTRLSHTARTAVYGTPAATLIFPALGNGGLTDTGAARPHSPMNRAHDGPLLGKAHALCGYQLRYLSAAGQSMTIPRGDNALTFKVAAMHMPWPILFFMPAALLLIHFANRNWWRENKQDYILMGLLQYLLTVRILIGVRGGYMDWQLLSSDIFSDVMAAFIALPVALTGLRPLQSLGWSQRGVMLAATVVLLALVVIWTRTAGASFWICAIFAASSLTSPVVTPLASRLMRKLEDPALQKSWRSLPHILLFAFAVIFAVAALRWGASLFGARERIFGIALSLPYLAVLLPCLAVGLAAITRSHQKTLAQALAFSLTLFVSIVLVPALVHDNGFALIYPLPILAVGVAEAWKWRASDVTEKAIHAAWRFAPAVAVALGLAWVWCIHPYLGKAFSQDLTGLDGIAYALEFDSSNDVRLLSLFHSDIVSGFGTRDAAANAQFWLDLHTFTRNYFGTGYLSGQSLGAFGYQALHFSDNLSAVHLMHPFGKLGAIAFLAVIFGSLVALEKLPQPDATGRILARLCLWAIMIIAAYMILANLGWVPFTGRNIYLLAVTSGSDLAEGFLLLAMATMGLRMGKAV